MVLAGLSHIGQVSIFILRPWALRSPITDKDNGQACKLRYSSNTLFKGKINYLTKWLKEYACLNSWEEGYSIVCGCAFT